MQILKSFPQEKIENIIMYMQLIQFNDNEYEVTTVTTIEEAKPSIATGFEYINKKNDIMLFRRPKRFSSLEM